MYGILAGKSAGHTFLILNQISMKLHIFAKFSIIMANLIVTQGGGDTQVGFGWVGGWVSAQSSKCEPYQGWSSSAPILSPDRRVLCASSPAKKKHEY